MNDYIKDSISKERRSESNTKEVLGMSLDKQGSTEHRELMHGEWLIEARSRLKQNKFNNPQFALLEPISKLTKGLDRTFRDF